MEVTEKGTKYVTTSEVHVIAKTSTKIDARVWRSLKELNPTFIDAENDPIELDDATKLVKFAGQLCYLSFGPNRTINALAQKYVNNILEQQHGSVLEHVNYSLLYMGIDRAVTHEFVRHRAGMGYSQVSQRYVGLDALRFVMPTEIQEHPHLVNKFKDEIDGHAERYAGWINDFATVLETNAEENLRDKRKRMQSFARRCLPNCTEAMIVATGNVRAWRHIFEKRLSKHADRAIREPMYKAFLLLREEAPTLFNDFEPILLPDGSWSASTKNPKV